MSKALATLLREDSIVSLLDTQAFASHLQMDERGNRTGIGIARLPELDITAVLIHLDRLLGVSQVRSSSLIVRDDCHENSKRS